MIRRLCLVLLLAAAWPVLAGRRADRDLTTQEKSDVTRSVQDLTTNIGKWEGADRTGFEKWIDRFRLKTDNAELNARMNQHLAAMDEAYKRRIAIAKAALAKFQSCQTLPGFTDARMANCDVFIAAAEIDRAKAVFEVFSTSATWVLRQESDPKIKASPAMKAQVNAILELQKQRLKGKLDQAAADIQRQQAAKDLYRLELQDLLRAEDELWGD